MIVSPVVSPLWQALPQDHRTRLAQAVERGLGRSATGRARVYFRADDVAVPGSSFSALIAAFAKARAPLCLAVVPAWLTADRWNSLRAICPGRDLWCWCQHGWRHINHEPEGAKKREFGQARPARDKRLDIAKGFDRLNAILGADFTPVFSPPWNRCDGQAMAAMAATGIKALSRTVGAGPQPPDDLPDFPVRVDLHTRKEADPDRSLDALLGELADGLAGGQCGVMIHHQRMNGAAVTFLENCLDQLAATPGVELVHFGHLLEG